MSNSEREEAVVEMRNITKMFGSFTANNNIDFTLRKGEVHALLGENGAGKTTLMNILYGLLHPDSGEIFICNSRVRMKNPAVAIAHGIGMVHQHFMLVQPFTVTENIILGCETTKTGWILDIAAGRKKVRDLSEKYGLQVDPDARICDITVGMQQRVEILKALYRGAEILILDEPTAVLTPQEIIELQKIMRNLTANGKSIIIITHKLKEIKQSADRCTIIRRGHYIDTLDVSGVTERELASRMVGREINFSIDKKECSRGNRVLELRDLVLFNKRNIRMLNNLTLDVHAGEIVGLAGVDGNGQSELIESIMGVLPVSSGSIFINGTDMANKAPRKVIESGIASIPEDRQKRGLVLEHSVSENMIIENYYRKPFSSKGLLDKISVNKHARELIERFDIRPDDPQIKAGALSGGNQQKVIIAREVSNNPDLLIAAQPTRGLDVGAIEFVHRTIIEQRDRGKAVLLVSFELDEILQLSDRIAVIYEGKITGVLNAQNTDENEIGLMMAGGAHNES